MNVQIPYRECPYRTCHNVKVCIFIVEFNDAPATIPYHLLTRAMCLSQCNSTSGFLSVILLDIRYRPHVRTIELKKSTKSENK